MGLTPIVALDPVSVTGYFYHPFMIGVVHLVTLGWISGSILGAIFVVGPLALRMPMPVGRLDYWAFAFYVIGVSGIVSHFWIEQYSGMVWSAAMVVLAIAQVTGRVLRQLVHAQIPLAVRLHIGLACINFLVAGTLGMGIGANREVEVIPGSAIANVYSHAHLAGVGWATLMVVGVGYRLLPMILPSAMPGGFRVVASVVLVQVGTLGLFLMLLLGGQAGIVSALLTVAGVATFLANAVWMRRHPRPAPPARPRPDWGALHALQALVYLPHRSGDRTGARHDSDRHLDGASGDGVRDRGAHRIPVADRHRNGAAGPAAVPVAHTLQSVWIHSPTTRPSHDGVATDACRRVLPVDRRRAGIDCGAFDRAGGDSRNRWVASPRSRDAARGQHFPDVASSHPDFWPP